MSEKDFIAGSIAKALSALSEDAQLESSEIRTLLEAPRNSSMGDIAFPCFPLAKTLRKAPPAIASEIAERILAEPLPVILSKVVATGPYLNFFLNKTAVAAEIIPSILSGSFHRTMTSKNEKVMVEYSQPNTHKAFHVGHIRSASLGDSVGRILEWIGHEVVPVNYIGDEGTHVARCLWYYQNVYDGPQPETHLGEFLGKMYTKATDLLSLGSYTRAPYPGVVAARVVTIEQHPDEKDWQVVGVETTNGTVTVICAGKGFAVGDLVAYAPPQTRVKGRLVEIVEKGGITSTGMLCAEAEIELSNNGQQIAVLPAKTELGTEVAELYRIEEALPADSPVLEHHRSLMEQVSKVLQEIEGGNAETQALWKTTKEWSMKEFFEIYKWLNCRFEHFFFESEFGESGKEIAREFQEKGVFEESDGAVGANLRDYNLGFCVLIKKDGTALYSTRDLALAKVKFEKYEIDRSLYVVDSAQSLHFQQVFKCLELMGYEQASNCHHLAFAQVTRPDGKMSSRKGNVILFSELEERLTSKITEEFLEKYRGDWSDQEIADAAYKLSLATIRYGMLNQDNQSLIVFDLDEWTSRSGNTGPYLMYAFARIQSILRDAEDISPDSADWSLLSHQTEIDLIMHLKGYHTLVERAADSLSPHLLCSYIYDLSKKFSKMYAECSILKAENDALKNARLCFAKAVGENLKHGLSLLGIKTVDRM